MIAVGDDVVQICYVFYQGRGLDIVCTRKIGTDAMFEHLCLSHIDHLTFFIFPQVYAWSFRQESELLF